MNKPLPVPDSSDLNQILTTAIARDLYRALYEHRDRSVTMAEIREYLGIKPGEQEQLGRRLRSLRAFFEIDYIDEGYKLIKRRDIDLNSEGINNRVRAIVLQDGRCKMCGRTVAEHHVVLHVDHKLPQSWGGTNDIDNLQALCEQCNEGKKDRYASYQQFADEIRLAATYREVHRRLGELLKAFEGKPVPADLLEMVAKMQQYQDDWQRRLRELKDLGWEYSYEKKREGDRFVTYYSLIHAEPWPAEGEIRAAIRQRSKQA